MRVFYGIPTDTVQIVRATDEKGGAIADLTHSPFISAPFTWGTKGPGDASLAAALAWAAADGDEALAHGVYQRLKWRTVETWEKGKPWTVTSDELLAQIAEIQAVEKETAPARRSNDPVIPQHEARVMMPGGAVASEIKERATSRAHGGVQDED